MVSLHRVGGLRGSTRRRGYQHHHGFAVWEGHHSEEQTKTCVISRGNPSVDRAIRHLNGDGVEFDVIHGRLHGRLLQIRRLSDLVISIRTNSLTSACTHSVRSIKDITRCAVEYGCFETGLVRGSSVTWSPRRSRTSSDVVVGHLLERPKAPYRNSRGLCLRIFGTIRMVRMPHVQR